MKQSKRFIISFVIILVTLVSFYGIFYLKNTKLPKNIIIDKILIEKSKRKLHLIKNDKILKTYSISLGKNPKGDKLKEGDSKTPTGQYKITHHNKNSNYHKSLLLSYPNSKDKEEARKNNVNPGGNIMIHGIKNKFGWIGKLHVLSDWTEGCIAVTNKEIEEIYNSAPNGTIVNIKE